MFSHARGSLRTLATIVTLLAAAGCAAQGPTTAEKMAAAEALDRRYVEAFNKDDADALMATYWKSPELLSIGLDGIILRGWETTSVEWHASMDGHPNSRLEFLESNNALVGEGVMGWGRWRLTTVLDSGSVAVLEGPYSNIKAQKDGEWVIIIDHASMPASDDE